MKEKEIDIRLDEIFRMPVALRLKHGRKYLSARVKHLRKRLDDKNDK